jgi:hypothetical protein
MSDRYSALFVDEGPIRVVPWPDPVADEAGFPAQSAMIEWCYLPLIGPSAAWAYRRLVLGPLSQGQAFDLELDELAHWLGLGAGISPNSRVARTLLRLVAFGLAAVPANRTLAVRRTVPPLRSSQLDRLSPRVQRVHATLLAQRSSGTSTPAG